MARPPRIDLPDGLYHVTSRGNGRAAIFWTDDDRQRFLSQLADNVQTAGVVLSAYVLMDNHFHLLVRTPHANLSRFLQRLITSYALYARYAVGDEQFIEKTERGLATRREGRAQDRDMALPKPHVGGDLIDKHVAAHFRVVVAQLCSHGHRGGMAKYAAVELACRLTGLTQRDVGQRYGGITSAAVSIIRRKIRSNEYPLRAIVKRLEQQIRESETNHI